MPNRGWHGPRATTASRAATASLKLVERDLEAGQVAVVAHPQRREARARRSAGLGPLHRRSTPSVTGVP